MPRSIYGGTVALLMAATVVSLLQKQGALESTEGQAILRSYSDFLGLAGVTALAQATLPPFPRFLSPGMHVVYRIAKKLLSQAKFTDQHQSCAYY